MAKEIQTIFVTPAIAIARLGGSTNPQDAYKWVESPNPRTRGETAIAPDWSLTVQPDGTVEPAMPTAISFRDGALIKPVCPFFEVWAMVGEPGSAPATWQEVRVTPALLTQNGAALSDLVFRVDAQNLKVARRVSNPELRYGTFPPPEVRANSNSPKPILASSPAGVPAGRRMIPSNRNIPLGVFQVMKSRPQPAAGSVEWSEDVNVEVIRFRFTPARGHSYGPPQAALPKPPSGVAPVDSSRAFLNQNAGWAGFNAENNLFDPPQDTYDGAAVRETGANPSFGIVDDTCGVRIEISLRLPPSNKTLITAATVFVAPPDFAPDRRPLLSLADELNDRGSDGATRTAAMRDIERDKWVEDLFERVYETLSLLNVDYWRTQKALRLTGNRLAPPMENDATRAPSDAMGGRDKLRNPLFPLPAESANTPLPLTEHARMRHRTLADLDNLRGFIVQNPGRLRELIRSSFEAESGETADGIGETTMRMPPFMRNSSGGPLTLASWQYDLVMSWVNALEQLATAAPEAMPALTAAARPLVAVAEPPAVKPLSEQAARRQEEVMARITAGDNLTL